MGGLSSETLSVGLMSSVLTATALGLFAWMAALQWTDSTGVSVAVIFVVIAVVQTVISVIWYRSFKQRGGLEEEEETAFQPVEEMEVTV